MARKSSLTERGIGRLVKKYGRLMKAKKELDLEIAKNRDHILKLYHDGVFKNLTFGNSKVGNITIVPETTQYHLDRDKVKFLLAKLFFPHMEWEFPLTPGMDNTITQKLIEMEYFSPTPVKESLRYFEPWPDDVLKSMDRLAQTHSERATAPRKAPGNRTHLRRVK